MKTQYNLNKNYCIPYLFRVKKIVYDYLYLIKTYFLYKFKKNRK